MNYYKNIVSQILKMTSDGFIITDTEEMSGRLISSMRTFSGNPEVRS